MMRLIVLLCLFAWSAAAQEKPPIRIAHTAPLSGPLALIGKLQAIAVDIGAADVNAAGGINGSRLEIIHYDDQLKPEQGILRIREAINAGAVGIIGPLSGTQWETASPALNQLHFPGININANKPGINHRPWTMRLTTTDDMSMPEGLDEFLRAHKTVHKVVVMADVREATGKAALDAWTDLAKARGLEVIDQITFTSGTTDFSPAAIKVKQLAPDAILIAILQPDAIRLARELHQQEVRVPILGNAQIWPGTLPQTLAKTIGEDAALWHTTGFSTNEDATGDKALYAKFVERYDAAALKDSAMAQFQPPNVGNASLGYDVVLLMADMLRGAHVDGATPILAARDKLMEAMVAIKEARGVNAYKFTEAGDAYIPTRTLLIDPAKSEWSYLPR